MTGTLVGDGKEILHRGILSNSRVAKMALAFVPSAVFCLFHGKVPPAASRHAEINNPSLQGTY